MCLYRGTMGLHHSFTCPYQGQAFLCVKKWFEAQISGILPDVFSYISHFVCLYNFNYIGRPLRGPGIIGIIRITKDSSFHFAHPLIRRQSPLLRRSEFYYCLHRITRSGHANPYPPLPVNVCSWDS